MENSTAPNTEFDTNARKKYHAPHFSVLGPMESLVKNNLTPGAFDATDAIDDGQS